LADAEKNGQRKGAGGDTEDNLEKTRKLADSLDTLRKQLSDRGQRGSQQQQGDQANRNQQQGGNQQQQNQNQPGQGQQNQPGRQGKDQQIAQNQKGQRGQDGRQQNQNRGQQDGRQQGNQQGEQQQGGQQQGGQPQGGQQQGGQQQGGQPQGGQQQGGQQQGGQPQGGQQPGGQQQTANGANRGGQITPGIQNPQNPSSGGPPRGDNRQLGSELGERMEEAEERRLNLGKDRDLANNLDQGSQGLGRGNDAITREDMQTALLLKDQVIEPLRNIELELSKRLQLKLGKNNLRLSDEGEAPAAYRKLVDEYYKRLS